MEAIRARLEDVEEKVVDHEQRIRVLEHFKCPSHDAMSQAIADIRTEMMVNKKVITILVVAASMIGDSIVEVLKSLFS